MQISKKGRGIVAVVRSRQVAAVRESSDRGRQSGPLSLDSGERWSLHSSGR